jgi:predicted nucleic acid-binding protein
VAELLSSFWPDDVSLLDRGHVEAARLLDSAHVTDSYLLALAHAHHGQLATFDQRMPVESVVDGAKALHLIQ